MAGAYNLIRVLHNAVGGLTLLFTLAATVLLLATSRTTSGGSQFTLRAALISGSTQFVLGLLMVIISLVSAVGYGFHLWVHYLLGIVSVGLISVVVARARRSPDGEARRYGLFLLLVAVVVLFTFTVGQRKLFAM